MGVIKRKADILGLQKLDVLIEDTTFESTYFQVLECPSILTQGKSSFLIGGSGKLKTGIEVKVEIVNNETNEVLYTEPIRGHLEGNLRRVSIEVYEDVIPGPYTLYIVGELNPSVVSVPQEWQGTYNVRWSKQITVNGLGVNTQPIYFYKQPTLNVSEIFTGFVEIPSSSATPIYLTGSGEPRQGLSPIAPVENSTGGGFGTSTYPELDFANKAKLSIIEENKPLVKLSGKHGLIGSQGQQVQTMSPVPNDFVITVSGDSSVNSLYVGHNITINNPEVDTSKFTTQSYHSIPAVYSSSVMKVLNNTSFVPKDVFYVYDNRTSPATLEPAPLVNTYPISASYLTLPAQNTSSINLLSFADIQLSDLRTFSGDVHKLKIYAKSEGSLGDFQLIYDSPVESSQVLYDKTEDTLLTNMGYFLNTSRLQKYWEIYEGNDGGTSGTLTYSATYINDAMKVSGSNKEYKDALRVQNKTAVDFVKGTLYSFRAKVYGIKRDKKDIDGNVTAAASFKVFAKGDAFDTEIPTSANWGAEKLSIPDFPTGTGEYDFGIVEGNFIANNTGTGYVQFKVESGEWYVSDIQLKAATDTAFNPDFVRVKAPVPPLFQRPDRVRFLVEFYDVNNNIADSVIFSEPFDFQGANINISGTDNILSGSMFIGNALASGIEMAGVSSAYVRSMGYLGFSSGSGGGNNPDGVNSGFLMWSGSVLPDSGDDYKGVGLELVGHSGSYFKFRTNPSELDIRTDKFFIGQDSIQYMSGSDGNIEISSSIFHLDPQNNVLIIGADAVINADLSVDSIQTPALIGGAPSTFANASASITAQGNVSFKSGSIAGWKIIGSKLSGSNATLDAEGAALYHSLKGPGSDTSAAFDQLRDEYYIDFTPSQGATATAGKYYVKFGPNFSVSQSGVLFASGAVFEGTITASAGLIGGWSIEPTYIGSVPDGLRLYGNSSDSPYHISSSDFQVRTTGEITASAGLIGGWTINDDYISKALSGSAAHQAYTRVYLSATTDDDKNIAEGLQVYRKDQDVEDGEVKVVRVGGLSDTTGLHSNDDYGFQIIQKDTNDNYSNIMYIGKATQTISGFSINPVAIHSSDKSLVLSGSGEITGSQVLFTGGKIAGWELSSTRIQSPGNTMRFTSTNPKITMETHTFEDGPGIQLGFNSGKVEFYAGDGDIEDAATNYLKFHEDTGIDIKTSVFKLDTATFDVDSSTNSGKLAMGSTPPTAYNSGNGIYMDGNANLLIGSSSADHIQYDSATNAFDVKVGSLELDATDIEISSRHASMSLGEGNIILDGENDTITVGKTSGKQITILGSTSQGYIATGKTSATSTTSGFWLANNNADPEFHIGNSTNYIKFDGGDLDITSEKLEVSASTIQLSTTQASMSLGHSTTYPQGRIIIEGSGTPTFRAGTDAAWISMTTGSGIYMDGDGNFKFGDNEGQVKFYNGSFSITGSDAQIQVTDINIRASGFQLSSNEASMSLGTNFQWKAYGGNVNPYLSIGQAGSGSYGATGLFLGYNNTLSRPRVSFVGSTGYFKFDQDAYIKTQNLEVAASNIQLSSTQASMSLGGVPGSAANILLDGASSKIEVGSSNKVTIQGGSSDNYMSMGGKSSFSDEGSGTAGIIIGMDGSNTQAEFVKSSTEYLIFDGSSGIDIKTINFELNANTGDLQLSSAEKSMSLGDGGIILQGASSPYIQVGSSNSITLKTDGTDQYMIMGSKTSFSHLDQSTQGIILGVDSGTPKFEMVGGVTNYLSYDGTNFDIKLSEGLELDATNIELSSTNASMSLGEGKIVLQGASSPFMAINSGSANQILVKTDGSDAFMTMGSKTSFSHEGSGTAGILIGMDSSNPQAEFVKSSTNYFIFDGSTGVDIKTTALELDAGTGDLQLSSTHKSMSLGDGKVILQGAAAPYMVLNSGSNSVTLKAETNDAYMVMGSKTNFDEYDKSTVGIIVGMDTGVPKLEMAKDGSDYLRWDSTDGLDLRTTKMEVSASNIQVSSLQASMSIGDPASTGGAIVLHADGTDKMLKFGGKTTFDQTTTAGLIMGMDATQPEFDYTVGTSNDQYIRMSPGGIDIKTPTFQLDTDRLDIDSATSRIDVYDASDGLRVRIGEVDPTAGSHYGMVIYDGSGTAESNELVHFSDARNKIASWTISSDQIASNNIIIHSSGKIETADFASNVKGWRISSEGNGTAEFENVRIRGTLATTVFEKESVNAVGGQLLISNSTQITGSTETSPSESAIHVENVSGFQIGEILKAKKVSATGFQTEYLYVTGSKRTNDSSDTDLSGFIHVTRGYSGSLHESSSFLAGLASNSQSYEPGQVLVSTGVTGSGFILLNANPSDTSTPYIDIIERTGSNIYDIEHKVRLGDLSGLSSGLLYGEANPGFGLFTENIFLKGSITAMTGSIEGILHVRTDASNQIHIGKNVSGTKDGFHINNNNYWYTNAEWRLGDTNNYLFLTGSGGSLGNDLRIQLEKFELNANGGDLQISSTHKSMSFGDGDIIFQSYDATNAWGRIGATSTKAIYITGSSTVGAIRSGKKSVGDTTAGFWLANNNGQPEFYIGDSTDYIKYYDDSGDRIEIQTRAFELDAGDGDLVLSSTHKSMSLGDSRIKIVGQTSPYIQVGNSPNYSIKLASDGTDQYMVMGSKTSFSHEGTGTGGILIGMDNDNPQAEFVSDDLQTYFIFDGDSGLNVKTTVFELDAGDGDVQISSTHASMSLGGQRIVLQGDSNPFIAINSGSANDIKLKTDGVDAYMSMGNKDDFGDEGTGTTGILIGMDATNPQAEFVKSTSNYFIFDGTSGVDIRTTKLELDAGAGDVQISTTQASMSLGGQKITLQGQTAPYIAINSGSTNQILIKADGSDAYMTMGSKTNGFTHEGKGTAGILIGMDASNPQAEFVKSSTDYFIFDGSSGVDIQSTKFELNAGSGDLQLSSGHASMSLANGMILLDGQSGDANTAVMRLGGHATLLNNIIMSGSATTSQIKSGKNTFADSNTGFYLERTGTSTKFHVGSTTEYISFDGNNIDLSAANFNLTASNVNIEAGDGMEVDAPHFELSTANISMSLGYDTSANYGINLYGGASANYIKLGNKASSPLKLFSGLGDGQSGTDTYLSINGKSFGSSSQAGIILGSDNGVYKFEMYKDADEYFTFTTGTDGLDVQTTKLNLTTNGGLTISGRSTTGTDNKIMLGSATTALAGEGFFVDGGGNFRIGDAVAGGTDLIYFTSGGTLDIRSSNFHLSGSTTLAISNTKIRLGTSATSTLTHGSTGIYLDKDAKFSFVEDAYNYIKGGSNDFELVAENFRLSGSTTLAIDTSKIRLGTAATTTLSHGSDGIFLNSSGHFSFREDQYNYIKGGNSDFEIVSENFRVSGSTTLAIDGKKIRLGTAATTTLAFGSTGIYLDYAGDFSFVQDSNNYIKGGNSNFDIKAATFNLLAGNLQLSGSSAGAGLKLGTVVRAVNGLTESGAGLSVDSAGNFLLRKDADNKISMEGGELVIKSEDFDLKGGSTLGIDTSRIFLGTITSDSDTTGAGVFMDSGGHFRVIGDADNQLIVDGGDMTIKSENFDLKGGSTLGIDTSRIFLGTITSDSDTTGQGVFMDSGGHFRVIGDTDNQLIVDGGSMTLKSDAFDLIGGSTLGINTSRIFLGTITSDSDSTGAGVYMDTGGAFRLFGNSTNYLTVDAGSMALGSDVFTLETDTLKLNSAARNGYIAMGASPPQNASGSTGFYADGNGTFMIGNSSGNRMQYLADGSIYMKSTTFSLDATTILLDSSAADGTIRLGTLADATTTATTNKGFRATGEGNMLLKADDSDTNYIKFNPTGAGSALEIKTADFQVVGGNVTATGTINANTGTFGGTSNGWTIATSKLSSTYSSKVIGLVQQNAAHADVGSVSAFYAGASADTGEDSTISFGSDGKIRGTGIYERGGKDFLIAAESTFGDGADGDITIRFNADGSKDAWTGTNTGASTHEDGMVTSPKYGDNIIDLDHASNYVSLQRDIYCKKLILDVSAQDQSNSYIFTNGYRVFASDGVFIYSTSGKSTYYVRFFNNGRTGGSGGSGASGNGYTNGSGGDVDSGTAKGGAAGIGVAGYGGTLKGADAGSTGVKGGDGGRGWIATNTGNATAGIAGSGSSPTLSGPTISGLAASAGVGGGSGGASASGGTAGSSAGQSATAADQAGIVVPSTPATSIVKCRTEFGSNTNAERLQSSTLPGGNGSGGGGAGSFTNAGAVHQAFGGGGGGGSAAAGSAGGIVLIAARVVDFWNPTTYGTATTYSPGTNSGGYGKLYLQAIGGTGGTGGNGGSGGTAEAS